MQLNIVNSTILKSLIIGATVTLGVGIKGNNALAGCNFHGCSQSSVAECNFHGCPNAPMGAECNFHGCPPSPPAASPPPANPNPPSASTVIVVPNGGGQNPPPPPNPGGSGEAIAKCMESLLYIQTYTGRVRSRISEETAVQACQNAR